MKRIYLALIMILCAFSCHATIIQVDDMKEVFDHFNGADSRTLAIFDVDMVLIQPSDPAFQMANMKRFSAISKRIMKEIPAEKQMLFLASMTLGSNPVLVDERTPQLLQHITTKGIPAMALTANLTGAFAMIPSMEQWRVDNLRQLGIDFSKTAPCQTSLVFDDLAAYRGNYSTYRDGILFVNGTTVSKGDAFVSFLKKTGYAPEKIVFIDDREENLKSLEAALQKLDRPIEFVGIHYLGAQKYSSKLISEDEFETKWQQLANEL